jgi:hypothetical protein
MSTSPTYTEPPFSVVCLDYRRPIESRLCLQSIRDHVKVPHRVIFCDNGSGEDYSLGFVRDGLVDQLIVNRDSRGLALGTKDLLALSASPFSLYLQCDQYFSRDLEQPELDHIISLLGQKDSQNRIIASISLAGAPCGPDTYSERAHLIPTLFYQDLERAGVLGYHGAGIYHDGEWREAQMQRFYREHNLTHYIYPVPLVQDNGVYAVRDMGEGGLFLHRTDTKQMWVIRKPKDILTMNSAYPKLMEEERELLMVQGWPDGRVPLLEQDHSFRCWDHTVLAQMETDYIRDLRRRVAEREGQL